MYWWTNIAVDEAPDLRVIAPAESVLHNAPDAIDLSPLPLVAGEDITYSVNNRRSCEYFFRIPDGCRRWVAGLDGAGRGLVHTSTDRLRGRKMFCWGTLPGSRRWQEFLAGRGHAYVELQGGLARTQLESLPMPARTEWAWTEAFGLLEADPRRRTRRRLGSGADRRGAGSGRRAAPGSRRAGTRGTGRRGPAPARSPPCPGLGLGRARTAAARPTGRRSPGPGPLVRRPPPSGKTRPRGSVCLARARFPSGPRRPGPGNS